MEREKLQEMSYRDLQKLAKKHNIKANQKKEELIEELSEVGGEEETEEVKKEPKEGISVLEKIRDFKKSILILTFIGILIVAAVAAINYNPLVVEKGDTVRIRYELYLESGELKENGTMNFTVGKGEVIKGLEDGIMGMIQEQEKEIVVPPKEGYGTYNPVNVKIMPEYSTTKRTGTGPLTVLENITEDEVVVGNKIKTQTLPWKIEIQAIETVTEGNRTYKEVTYKHSPVNGSLYTDPILLPWSIKVVKMNETTVVYQNKPEINKTVVSKGRTGKVTKIEDEKITVDFNHELAGETLTFKVKVLDIDKA